MDSIKMTRKDFLKAAGLGGLGIFLAGRFGLGGSLLAKADDGDAPMTSNTSAMITDNLPEGYEWERKLVIDTIPKFATGAAGWDNEKTYSGIDKKYPHDQYDIEELQPYENTSDAEMKAWSKAQPIGDKDNNTIHFFGSGGLTADVKVMYYIRKNRGRQPETAKAVTP